LTPFVRYLHYLFVTLELAPYRSQREQWPASGRHIMAQHGNDWIIVYQAYRPEIAEAAVRDQRFGGGGFSLDRMSWIKPNFLWMMFRCAWATSQGQERVLAIRIATQLFDDILRDAVHSSYVSEVYQSSEAWKSALKHSDVRLQWDPDHDPSGAKLQRRAIQLGLRGNALKKLAETPLEIEDITTLVHAQRPHVGTDKLMTPLESPYLVRDSDTAARLGLALAQETEPYLTHASGK
jgi:hypothetical protein